MKNLVVVEDNQDIQLLVQTVFFMDKRFAAPSGVESAEEGLELASSTGPGLIVLDHGLTGKLTGLQASRWFKRVAPNAKIILFTAHDELRALAEAEPAIDAFLLKTEVWKLLAIGQRLSGLSPAQVDVRSEVEEP